MPGRDGAAIAGATSEYGGSGRTDPASERVHGLGRVDHVGGLREAVADQLAPFLEVGRAAEVDRVVLDRLPGHEQVIVARLFDAAVKRHAGAPLRAPEYRRGLGDAGLE